MSNLLTHIDRLKLGPVEIDLVSGDVRRPSARVQLSKMEQRVLRFMVRHAGEAVSREQLLVDVWGYSHLARTRTVDATMSRLRSKIELQPTSPEFLKTVYGVGYRLEIAAPEPLTPRAPALQLIGRSELLSRVEDLLMAGALVTLTGPPGVGKSAALKALAERICGPCRALELEAENEPWSALSRALDSATATPGGIAAALRRTPALVLLLDVGAQAAEALEDHLADWSTLCGGLVLASRSPLGLRGERVVVVEPLGVDEGVRMLEDHLWRTARRRLTEEARASLPELVERLDGLPAPLELAAHHLRTLPPASLIALLGRAGLSVLGARQSGFRAAFRELHTSLSDRERLHLCVIAAFPVGLRCSALIELLEEEDAHVVLQVLKQLTQRGLVRVEEERVSTLRSVREELCSQAREVAKAAHELALAWMSKLARGLADPPHLAARLQRLFDEWENLYHLWEFAVHREDPRGVALAEAILVGHVEVGNVPAAERVFATTYQRLPMEPTQLAALQLYRGQVLQRAGDQEMAYEVLTAALRTPDCPPDVETLAAACLGAICATGHRHAETMDWLTRPPAPASSAWVRATAARSRALGFVRLGRYEDAKATLAPARRAFRRMQDSVNERRCLFRLSWVTAEQGHLDDALRYLERAGQLLDSGGAQRENHELSMGVVLHDAGDLEGAARLLRSGAERVAQEHRMRPEFLSNLGWVLVEAGQHMEAEAHLLSSIDHYERLAHWANVSIATLNLAALRHLQDRLDEALALVSELGDKVEGEVPQVLRAFCAGHRAALLADLDKAPAARAAWEQAQALSEGGDRVLRGVLAHRQVHLQLREAHPSEREARWLDALADLNSPQNEPTLRCSDLRVARQTLERAAHARYGLPASVHT